MSGNKTESLEQQFKSMRKASMIPPPRDPYGGMGNDDGGAMKRKMSAIEEIQLEEHNIHNKLSSIHEKSAAEHANEGSDTTSQMGNLPGFGIGKLRYQFLTPEEFSDDEEPTALDIMNAFRDTTTAHGVPHIGNAKGLLRLTFWTLMSLLMTGGMIYNLYSVSSKYFSYPVTVNIAIQHANDLDFPAVTICNMSPVKMNLTATRSQSQKRRRRSASSTGKCCCTCCAVTNATQSVDACSTCLDAGYPQDQTCSSVASPTTAAPETTAGSTKAAETTTTTTRKTTTTTPVTATTSALPTPPPTRQDFNQEQQLTETLSSLSGSQRNSMGYSMNDLILDCQYAGSNCDPKWFTSFWNPVLGNCYVFNSGWNNVTVQQSHRTGRRFGLQMTLNIDQSTYSSSAGDTAGVRLAVHDGDIMPFPEDEGITISPGHSTSVGIQKVFIERLGQPYGECIDGDAHVHDFSKNVYEEQWPDTFYSVAACSRTCYQSHVIERCQCGDMYYPLNGTAFGGSTIWPVCSDSNITQKNCRYRVELDYNANKLNCNCPERCSDTLYTSGVSVGTWPSQVQLGTVLSSIKSKVTFNAMDNVTYKSNLVKVEVYYEEFNFQAISQDPAYEVASYFSDIGGALGLYLGMSLMTLVEFVELFTDVSIYLGIWARNRYIEQKRQRALAAKRSAEQHGDGSGGPTEQPQMPAALPWETTATPNQDDFVYSAYRARRPPSYNDVMQAGGGNGAHHHRRRRLAGRASETVRDILLNM